MMLVNYRARREIQGERVLLTGPKGARTFRSAANQLSLAALPSVWQPLPGVAFRIAEERAQRQLLPVPGLQAKTNPNHNDAEASDCW
jgi:hypothetical protein